MSKEEEKKNFSIGKRVAHVLEFAFALLLFAIINLFPFSALQSVTRFFRRMLSPLLNSGRRRIRAQVSEILGMSDEKELAEFANRNLDNTIRIFFEMMQSWKMRRPRFLKKYITYTQEARDIIADRSQGIVLVEGHFGNWEIAIPVLSALGLKINFSAQRLTNPYVDWMLHRIRMSYGGGPPIYLREAEKFIPLLRKREPLGLVADQDAGDSGIFIDFMGKKAATHVGPAILAYLGKARLAIVFCTYQGSGKYVIDARQLYRFQGKSDFASSTIATQALTRLWVDELEKAILKYPDQYFWAHRRWKTRPPEESVGHA